MRNEFERISKRQPMELLSMKRYSVFLFFWLFTLCFIPFLLFKSYFRIIFEIIIIFLHTRIGTIDQSTNDNVILQQDSGLKKTRHAFPTERSGRLNSYDECTVYINIGLAAVSFWGPLLYGALYLIPFSLLTPSKNSQYIHKINRNCH